MFKKLDIFMLRQFSMLFAGTFFISLFVLMMQFLWRYINDLIGKGLSMEVLGEFFWYMGLMLVPQAFPLAILLASLITMGNLGESSELTAIKASGISLLKSLRALIFTSVLIAGCSFVFQNNIGPHANTKIYQMLIAMRQKSPELEIPEGIFYNGIPNCNLYVQHKDMKSGMLYGVMIYRMTQSFEDAAIILADSGRLQSTAEKKHLKLTLYDGEWFENMQSQEMAGSASVPYRRESFMTKVILLEFDDGFNMAENTEAATSAQASSIASIIVRADSVHAIGDSIGRQLANDMKRGLFPTPEIKKHDSVAVMAKAKAPRFSVDTLYDKMGPEEQRMVMQRAEDRINMACNDLEFRQLAAQTYNQQEREYDIEMVNKFTLSLMCIVFFFIGASLGAIIRKGGLGVPVIISVLVFILFYILDNTGFRMARQGSWSIAFGKGLAPGVLIPLTIFVTYKANKDSVVFNMDAYRIFFMKLFGLRLKRNVAAKEVIIIDPDYVGNAEKLRDMNTSIRQYSEAHHLKRLPNPVTVFFKYEPDHVIEQMAPELEEIIDQLGNTRDRYILTYLNMYPIVSEKAHTRPFDRKWMNVTAAVLVPIGAILYLRMWRFRLRLYRDLRQIHRVNDMMIKRIGDIRKEEN